ncbi:unnamed protein product [Amoebophrya sp. A120]|nr:unnamed protein product [Amoebophrya sp. A120]|eukprot:GSA120T00003209001.1
MAQQMSSTSSMDCVLNLRPPLVAGPDFVSVIQELYGADEYGSLVFEKCLPSERDRNYLYRKRDHSSGASGSRVVFKISNQGDSLQLLSAQTQVILHCGNAGAPVQRVLSKIKAQESDMAATSTTKAAHACFPHQDYLTPLLLEKDTVAIATKENNATRSDSSAPPAGTARNTFWARLLTFVEGDVLSAVPPTTEIWKEAGRAVARVSDSLCDFYQKCKDMNDVAAELHDGGKNTTFQWWSRLNEDFEWNLLTYERTITKYLPSITDEAKRKFVENLVQQHGKRWRQRPELVLAHGDPNDNNLVVTREGEVVVLDFGDLCASFPFADASVGAAYAPSEECAKAFVNGCMEKSTSLTKENDPDMIEERIHAWAKIRRATSVCISSYQAQQHPDDEYLQCSADQMWRTLGFQSEGK